MPEQLDLDDDGDNEIVAFVAQVSNFICWFSIFLPLLRHETYCSKAVLRSNERFLSQSSMLPKSIKCIESNRRYLMFGWLFLDFEDGLGVDLHNDFKGYVFFGGLWLAN